MTASVNIGSLIIFNDSMVNICIILIRPPSYTGATVLEFGIPSGFTVELSSPKTRREHTKKTEIKDKIVILYYDEVCGELMINIGKSRQ